MMPGDYPLLGVPTDFPWSSAPEVTNIGLPFGHPIWYWLRQHEAYAPKIFGDSTTQFIMPKVVRGTTPSAWEIE